MTKKERLEKLEQIKMLLKEVERLILAIDTDDIALGKVSRTLAALKKGVH
ncbi:MAG: hypothetical protein PHD06_05220 [Bacteroidales bacterium]|nr:hypothetical protein [Bacteroidales bacterium]